MKTNRAVSRRLAFPAVSLAALVAGAPSAPAEDARRPSRKLMRLGLIFTVIGLVAAPLVALAVR